MTEKVICRKDKRGLLTLVFPHEPWSVTTSETCACWDATSGHGAGTYAGVMTSTEHAPDKDAQELLATYERLYRCAGMYALSDAWTSEDDRVRDARWFKLTEDKD